LQYSNTEHIQFCRSLGTEATGTPKTKWTTCAEDGCGSMLWPPLDWWQAKPKQRQWARLTVLFC